MAIKKEILYLLHSRKIGHRYERSDEATITSVIKGIISSPGEYHFNERVLVVLIESGYIQKEFSFLNPGDYPTFLKFILVNTERIKLKEASCR
jgi:hypothetical protein